MSQNPKGAFQDETDTSTSELIQHMLIVEDGISRSKTGKGSLMDEVDTNLDDTLRVVEVLNRSEKRGGNIGD